MATREDFIKKYATADVNGRMEIILKNYSRFIQMVDGYEEWHTKQFAGESARPGRRLSFMQKNF